jgi:hypothetical protein
VTRIELGGRRSISCLKWREDAVDFGRNVTHATGCTHSRSGAHQDDGHPDRSNCSLVK